MSGAHSFVIFSDKGENVKFSQETLMQHSDYFRALFDSGMQESQERKLKLNYSEGVHDDERATAITPFKISTVNFILSFLESDRKKVSVEFPKAACQRLVSYFRQQSIHSSSSTSNKENSWALIHWLLHADDKKIKEFLVAVGYLQFHGIVNLLTDCHAEKARKTISIEIAVRILPHALNSGLVLLHNLSIQSVAENYNEFLQLTHRNNITFEQSIANKIKRLRFGLDNEIQGLTAIFRTDITLVERRGLRCAYAIIQFENCTKYSSNDSSRSWKPRLIETFVMEPKEDVFHAAVIDNYLYIFTLQMCYGKNETTFKVYRFNPQKHRDLKKVTSEPTQLNLVSNFTQKGQKLSCKSSETDTEVKSPFQHGWCTDLPHLKKPGRVHNRKAVVVRRCSESSDEKNSFIYLLGGDTMSCPINYSKTRIRVLRVKMLCDVDCFDPMMNTWKICKHLPIPECKPNEETSHGMNKGFRKNKSKTAKLSENLKIFSSLTDENIWFRVQKPSTPKRKVGFDSVKLSRRYNEEMSLTCPATCSGNKTVYFPHNLTNTDLYRYESSQNKWTIETDTTKVSTPIISEDYDFSCSKAEVYFPKSSLSRESANIEWYCLEMNKTNVQNEDILSLVKTEMSTDGTMLKRELLHRLPPLESARQSAESNQDQIAAAVSDIDMLLMNSTIAVPRLFQLYFPNLSS